MQSESIIPYLLSINSVMFVTYKGHSYAWDDEYHVWYTHFYTRLWLTYFRVVVNWIRREDLDMFDVSRSFPQFVCCICIWYRCFISRISLMWYMIIWYHWSFVAKMPNWYAGKRRHKCIESGVFVLVCAIHVASLLFDIWVSGQLFKLLAIPMSRNITTWGIERIWSKWRKRNWSDRRRRYMVGKW